MKFFSKIGFFCLLALMAVSFSSCEKEKYNVDQLLGTWQYDENTAYTVTFLADGSLTYTAPEAITPYRPTYTLDGEMIYIRVLIGSTYVDDVIQITNLTDTKLVLYYDGDLLFDKQSLTGEYRLTKVK